MKRALLSALILAAAGTILFVSLRQREQPGGEKTIVPGHELITSVSANGERATYRSPKYGFSLVLPAGFSYRGFPESSSYGFSRPNPNTNEAKTRDTPNGFNTAADDSFGLKVYPNPNGLDGSDTAAFSAWRRSRDIYNGDEPIDRSMIGRNAILITTQADGIGSRGLYYYLFTPSYVFAFGTDDITDLEMRSFLFTLTLAQ